MLPRRVTSASAALVVLAACGTSGTLRIPTAAIPVDPCRVITPAEARRFSGGTATQHQDPLTRTCTYIAQKRGAIGFLQVQAFVGANAYRLHLFAHVRGLAHVGEKAYVHVDPARPAAQLRFVRRGRTFVLSYSVLDRRHPASPAAVETKLVALARRIANR